MITLNIPDGHFGWTGGMGKSRIMEPFFHPSLHAFMKDNDLSWDLIHVDFIYHRVYFRFNTEQEAVEFKLKHWISDDR